MKNLVKATTIAFALTLAMLAGQALAQNTNSTTTTQSSPSTQSGSSSQTTRETTTTTTQTKPTQTTRTETTTSGVDPIWLVLGGIALLAVLLIVFLSMRKRPRSDGETVYESKTVIKKE